METDEWHYIFHKNKRESSSTPTFIRRVQISLPPPATPSMWIRHQYSLADIKLTLNNIHPLHLWHLAILAKISLTNAALKPSYGNNSDNLIVGGKTYVKHRLLQYYTMLIPHLNENTNVLLSDDTNYKPPLPLHSITMDVYNELMILLSQFKQTQTYVASLCWRSINIIPRNEYRTDTILVERIVEKIQTDTDIDTDTDTHRKQLLTTVSINGIPHLLSGEMFYLTIASKREHTKKIKKKNKQISSKVDKKTKVKKNKNTKEKKSLSFLE